jgi:hypothetical protein
MAEQATRRAGRPKKAAPAVGFATEAPEPTPQPKKSLEFKVPKKKEAADVVYRIIKGGGVAFMLPQKELTVFDESTQNVRSIRYCPSEPSIYVDEQSENPRKEAVIFYDKLLAVPRTKPNLQAFLDAHPMNKANGGGTFYRVDKTQESKVSVDKEFAIADAITAVRDKSINELLPVAIYHNLKIDREFSEVRYDLLQIAKKNPTAFMESFDKPSVRARAIAVQANDYQIIKVSSSGAYWFDTNTLIVSNPVGMDSYDTLVRFMLTEKGSDVLSRLEDELSKL